MAYTNPGLANRGSVQQHAQPNIGGFFLPQDSLQVELQDFVPTQIPECCE
jgi:hypothetical protein